MRQKGGVPIAYQLTNVKFSCHIDPPLCPKKLRDIGLNYSAGSDRYVVRLQDYVYCFMSSGSFLNVTGCKAVTDFEKAKIILNSQLGTCKMIYSNIKIDTISAVCRMSHKIMEDITCKQAQSEHPFQIKHYRKYPNKVNVKLKQSKASSPNMSANIFSSGSICLFGARCLDDLEYFINQLNYCKNLVK